jgi:hypothetical protein
VIEHYQRIQLVDDVIAMSGDEYLYADIDQPGE